MKTVMTLASALIAMTMLAGAPASATALKINASAVAEHVGNTLAQIGDAKTEVVLNGSQLNAAVTVDVAGKVGAVEIGADAYMVSNYALQHGYAPGCGACSGAVTIDLTQVNALAQIDVGDGGYINATATAVNASNHGMQVGAAGAYVELGGTQLNGVVSINVGTDDI